LEADLAACAAGGDEVKLTAVEAMVVLGEVGRLQERLDRAVQLMRKVSIGEGCFGSQQGYQPCTFQNVDLFLADTPKRNRWWRRA
jgi:hypothetical protein